VRVGCDLFGFWRHSTKKKKKKNQIKAIKQHLFKKSMHSDTPASKVNN
jgi:hypothetical protein